MEEILPKTGAVGGIAIDVFQKDSTLQDHLLFWTMSHGISAGESAKKKELVQNLIGRSPDKVSDGKLCSYIWGMCYQNNPVLLCVNALETSIEVLPDFPRELLGDMLRGIRKILVNPEYSDNLFFKPNAF